MPVLRLQQPCPRAPIDEARFVAAFAREIAHRAALTPGAHGALDLLRRRHAVADGAATVGAILDAIAEHWTVEPDAEITLEANPTSVEAGRFRGYRAAGVNRVSLGVQALNDADLKALGRLHSVAEALAAVEMAEAIFERTSFDLIYARAGQTEAAWRAELERAMELAAEHLSLYQLTIEPDTMFERLCQAGKLVMPDEDSAARCSTRRRRSPRRRPAGLRDLQPRPARRGDPAQPHLLALWRICRRRPRRARPHRHGRASGARRRPRSIPEMWLGQVESEGHGLIADDAAEPEEQSDEFLLMGLRLREGIDVPRYEAISGRRLAASQIDRSPPMASSPRPAGACG